MAVLFKPETHSYQSVDPSENINWISVTTVISHLKQPFDAILQAKKSSSNPKSKWFKMSLEEIQKVWQAESSRSTDLGTFYHNQRESDVLELDSITRDGVVVPIFKPIIENNVKVAPSQKLVEGIYPEHFVYLKSAGICGQADRVEVINKVISIIDYKTSKKIDKESYKNWEGKHQMMTGPVSHIQDCNLNHYALQLSLYMYIMSKHNPSLKPGKLAIHHISFEIENENQYGYPITKLDADNNPILKNVEEIELPYYKQEIIDIFHWLADNRHKVIKK